MLGTPGAVDAKNAPTAPWVGSRAGAVLTEPVSSPRHLKLLVRISRKQLSCALRLKGYGTYRLDAPVDA